MSVTRLNSLTTPLHLARVAFGRPLVRRCVTPTHALDYSFGVHIKL